MRMHRALLLGTAALLAVVMQTTLASAHSGGRVQLYPNSFQVEHTADGWHLHLVLTDRDSGSTQTGFQRAAFRAAPPLTPCGQAQGHVKVRLARAGS